MQLLVHHSDGAIVRQSARRKAALEWIFERSDIFERAGQLLDECRALANATSNACREAVVSAGEQRLDQVAIEVAAAVHRMIAIGPHAWTKQAESELDRLSAHARNELIMLAAIERVSIDADGIEDIVTLLSDAGLIAALPQIVEAQTGEPFAWLLRASRPQGPAGPSQNRD